MKFQLVRVALVLLVVAMAGHAATITEYTTQSAFTTATTAVTSVDFASTSLGDYSFASGLTVGGVNIVGQDGAAYYLKVDDSSVDSNFVWGTHVLLGGNASTTNSYIQINLASVTAVALDLATFWPGKPVTVTLSSGESYTINTPSAGPIPAFWGFTSDTAETWVRVSTIGQNGSPVVVDFQYGTAQADQGGGDPADTPEVMTLLLIGSGLIFFRGLKRFAPPAAAA